jgi:hypothetical protein
MILIFTTQVTIKHIHFTVVNNIFIDVQNLSNQKKIKKQIKKQTPEPRERQSLTVFGKSKRSILFGGLGYQDEKNDKLAPLNDVWILTVNFEMKSVNWVKVSSKELPPERYDHSMCYFSLNPSYNFTILFGGFGNKKEFNDAWIFVEKSGNDFDIMRVIHREGVKQPCVIVFFN